MFQVIFRVIRDAYCTNKFLVISIFLLNLLFSILILVEPVFFREAIDTLISFEESDTFDTSYLISILLLWVAVGIITIGLKLFIVIIIDRFGHTQFNNNVFSFYEHVQGLSMNFHTNTDGGQLVKKITKGADGIFRLHLDVFRRIVPNIMTIIILIPVVLYFNLTLGLFVVGVGFLTAFLTAYLSIQTFSKQKAIEGIYSDMSSHYSDTFTNIPVIKSFGLKEFKNKQLQQKTDIRLEKQKPILIWWGLIISFSQIIKIITSIGIILLGSYLYIQGQISIGDIIMFLGFALIFLSAIESLTWTLESVFWNSPGIEEYYNILDTNQDITDKDDANDLKDVDGAVAFKNVDFSYTPERKILKNIDINIRPGEKIAFVGHTGSGKTTMINLLLRFYEPESGDIYIDEQSIFDVTQDSLRENIAVVFQDNSLFNTTIRDNITLNNTISEDKLEEILEKSHSDSFIQNLPNGLDTYVGERGVKLSGGEKQRLAIARAFVKDAPILILDEATSALDARTEKHLQSSFDALMEGRTTFIIAHRLSTIRKADRIFVFEQGKIVESGNYKDLYAQNGKFTELVDSQTKGFIE